MGETEGKGAVILRVHIQINNLRMLLFGKIRNLI